MLTIFSALLATCCTLHAIGYEVVDAVQMLSSTMQYNTDQYNSSSTMDVGQSISTENMNPELSSNSNISAAPSYSSQSSQSVVLIGCTTAAFSVVVVVFFVIVLVGYFRVRRSRDVSIVGHRKTLPTVNELDPIDRSSSSSYSRHTPTAPSSHQAGASEGHDVEGQKSTEDGARSEPIQMQTNSGTSEAETQVVRRARRCASDRKVLETWILPMHRRSFQLGQKRPQSADDQHDYVNVFERETADDVAHDYVNVDAAAKKSGGSTSYENCEVVKDPRRTSRDPKWGGNKTTHRPILDPSVKSLAKSVPAINLIYVRETAGVDSCSDDDSSLDSNYVDMASKQMKEKLQRRKLGPSLSSSAPEMASTKQIAIYENERIPWTKTRPISTKQNNTKFH